MSKNKMALTSKNEQVPKNAPTANVAVTRTEPSKKGANAPARPSSTTSLGRRALCLFLAVLLGISGALVDIPGLLMRGEIEQVYADDISPVDSTGANGTVPADENYTTSITTFNDGKGADTLDTLVGVSPYDGATAKVRQSQSTTSATTFAAGLPLSTIYIDQSKIKAQPGKVTVLPSDYSSLIKVDAVSGRVNFDAKNAPDALKMYAGKVNELKGNLYYVIFEKAAVLPDGSRADLKITYSDAKIVIDQRYAYDNRAYDGEIYLSQGGNFSYGGTSATDISALDGAATRQSQVNQVVQKFSGNGNFANTNMRNPMIGKAMDATYQIVTPVTQIPIEGTFIYAISGINLDRDAYRLSGTNYGKPLWYIDKAAKSTTAAASYFSDLTDAERDDYHQFSESLVITGGQASTYSYVRSNKNDFTDDNGYIGDTVVKPEGTTEEAKQQHVQFYSQVTTDTNGNTKFVGNADGNTSGVSQAADYTYSSGFVTLADAAAGFKVTAVGHGGTGGSAMNTNTFQSSTIWYRYISGSGKHGKIEITSEGNPGGNLSTGTVLDGGKNPYASDASTDDKPNTYVVPEGKTVTYTMTPEVGYKAKKITIKGPDGNLKEIEFDSSAVSKMKKGDFITVDTADFTYWDNPDTRETRNPSKGQGVLTYLGNGVYTFRFNHAKEHEEIYVEWEPTTADILAYKIWADDDDKDGIRYNADTNNALPKFKLQWTKNGRDWLDVTNEMDIGLRNADNSVKMYTLRTPVTEQTVPAGKVGSDYKDGTYVINNDPNKDSTDPNAFKHPFTWEYLPVYTYDRNGRADRAIQYRIVEIDDPWQYEYEKAKFYEHQIFDLTSPQDNSIEGWGLFTDGTNTYAKKGDEEYDDGLYYLVNTTTGIVNSTPVPIANQPNSSSLTGISSNDYWTEDHAVPYHEAEVKNEHYTSDIYVDVIKFWDDKVLTGDAPETSKDDYSQDIAGYKHNETGTQISPSYYDGLTPEEKNNYSPVYEYSNNDDPSVVIDQATYDGLPDTNQYARKAINIVLHGEIEGATPSAPNIVVDLDPNDPNTTDLVKTIKLNESDNKADVTGYEEVIDSSNNDARYVKYKGQDNKEYAYVQNKENVADGYYPITGGNVDYTTGPLTFNKGAITPIKKTEDGTYKINNDRYGAMFEWLPTHHDGKHIIYTVTETDENGDPLNEWILTGGQLAEVKEGSKLLGYETTLRNTPDVDIEYTPVPLTIHKVDKTTGNPLEGAEFTVYLNPTTKTVAPQSEDLIIGKTIYTRNKNYIKQRDTSDNTEKYYEVNGEEVSRTPADPQPLASELTDTGEKLNSRTIYNSTKDYIIQKDSNDNKYKYYEVISGAPASSPANPQPSVVDLVENGKLDGEDAYTDGTKTYVLRSGLYHIVDAEGNVESTPASPQPDPNVTRKAKDLKSGVVDKNVVVTDAQGNAEVTFLVPNNATQDLFYIQETNAPEGYYPDPEPYAFKIDAELKTITLETEDYDHTTPWWKKLYDLLFGDSDDDKLTDENWKPAPDNRGGTFTVEDTPIVADILVRKYWNDNNDQDGKRPGDKNDPTSTSDPNLPKVTLQYTLGAHTAEGSNIYTDGKRYYVHNPADDKYYEVDSPVTTQGSYGGNANPQPQPADLSKTGDTCRGYDVYTDGTTQYVRVGSRYRVVNTVDVRTPNEDSIGTYEYSAANPQPEGATKVNNETCAGLEVYKGTDNNKYVIIDHVYHKVNSIDVTGKVSATPAQEQPDPTDLELMLTGNWVNADGTTNAGIDPKLIEDEYRDPRVSYVGGPVLTHQNDAYTWTGLPAYMDGKVVTYRILETGDILDNTKDIYAYDIESNHTSQTHEKTFNLVNNSGSEPTGLNQTVDVTNKHETQVVNIVAYKEWEDEDPEDRGTTGPKLYLYKVLDGIEYPITTLDSIGNIIEDIATVPIQGESGEKVYVHTWKDLPTYENGQPVTYRIREEKPYGYITLYEAVYTDRAGNTDPKEDTTDIVAEDIRRTFYQRGDSIPDGKKVGDENTTARFDILNERSVNITVDKTWVNGANASVTYELWRTTTPAANLAPITRTPVSADDSNVYYVHKTIIITVDEYNALSADEKLKYELKYVKNSNSNDILTTREWSKLDNPGQLEYERKYVNTSDQTDIISIADYGALTPKGKNSYTDLEQYMNLNDSSLPLISVDDYNALPAEEQADYSRAYQDNEDASIIINALQYDNLTAKGQNNYAIKYVNKTDDTDIKDEADWAAIPNAAQAEYSQKYVDDRHVIISKDTYATLSNEEQANYEIEHTSSWSPYANGKKDPDQYALKTDSSSTITKAQYDELTAEQKRLYEPIGMVDGWELVDSHVFDANDFIAPSNTGDKDSWTFNDLLIKDIHGNKYTYRVLEKPALNRFRENQISDYDIINNNVNVSDGNVSLEVVKEVENRKWLTGDQFFFYLEPVKGIDITDPNAPVNIAKDKVPMPYRTDPATNETTYNYTADALPTDLQVGAIGRAATFQGIQYKENSALYHSIERGDIVEFYYRVYEVYDTETKNVGTNDREITVKTSLDDATKHSGYKDGITYAGTVSNLTSAEYSALASTGKDSYIQTSAYINENVDPVSIISITDYNALDETDKANYEATTGYVNINDASELITKEAYNALPLVGKNAYESQQGYIDKNGKAINEREYSKLSDADKAACTTETIYSAFIPTVHEARVIAKNVDGIITTETQWLKDGEYKTGAVPVYTNSYSSEGEAKVWVEKKISNRNWVDYDNTNKTGDAFSFKVESISGAQLNVPGSTSSDSYTSKPLMSNETNNPQADIQKISDTEYAFGLTGNKYDNTMLNSEGEAYFIYEISENPSVTYSNNNFDISGYTVDGLEYDNTKIYVRLKAKDNWDGTISFTVEYFTDASCKNEYKISGHEVWIQDDGTETNEGKKLVPVANYSTVEGMSATDREAAGYRKVDVAYFVNYETIDIPVKKEWVDGPAIEDVNLHLERHLFLISGGEGSVNDADINDEFVKARESGDDFWETAGYTHYAKRAEFLNGDGTPKYDAGSTTTSSNTYENIDGFNLNLPKYEHVGNKTYRIVYRLLEDDTSSTYTRSYKSIARSVKTPDQWNALGDEEKAKYTATWVNKEDNTTISDADYEALDAEGKAKYESKYVGEIEKANDYIYTDGDTLVVTNTVIATNVAKPAAVKQLQGRNWLDSDDYKFILTPIGKYDKDGSFVSTEEIPMPATDEYVSKTDPTDVISKTAYDALDPVGQDSYEETDDGRYVNKEDDTDIIEASEYAALTKKGQNSYKPKEINDEAHATKAPDTIVDPEGHLERLARFGEIEFSTKDLVYNETDKHYHGDFFYEIKEEIPAGSYAVDKASLEQVLVGENPIDFEESFTKAQREQYYWKDPATGIIYDGSIHTVHIQVKENRTSELQVQVAYDEETPGDISKGTQFTPVYTNRYDAAISFAQEVNKYIMGRDWKNGDVFDFRMTPVSGAPFVDADDTEFHDDDNEHEDPNYTDAQRNNYLNDKAVHSARGAHVNRLKVEGDAPADTIQKVMMPALKFELSDLHKTVETTGAIKYKDGTDVPAGMAYGQFIYSFEETEDYLKKSNSVVPDLSMDPDTEYVRITVIDKGNGTLDYYTEVFEDRYCTVPRFIPGTTEPAKNPTFVNQLKRELSITKTWVDPATSDITLRLEWSVNEQNWYAVDEAEWLPAGIRNAQIIEKNAYGDALTVTWRNLPAYANIPSEFTTTGNQTGDDQALNDLWVYYRIVEDDVDYVETRYSKEPYAAGESYDLEKYKKKDDLDSPHTGAEKETSYDEVIPDGSEVPSNEGWFEYDGENYTLTTDTTVDGGKTYYTSSDKYVTNRVKQLYVTNWPKDVEGEAKVGIVKQYIGKAWDNEKFTFEIEPIKSMIGSESAPVNNGDERLTGNYIKTADGSIISGAEYDAIVLADPSKASDYEPEKETNVMPEYNKANKNEAVATKDPSISDKVSVNEYSANFDPLTIKLSDLAVDRREKIDDPNNPAGPQIANPNYGKAVGTFYYKIKEQIPTNAVEINEVCGKDIGGNDVKYKVGSDDNLNKIKYTTEEHIVKIFAVDDGSGKIDIITSFDEREHGEYVPVYTNYAMVETPIEGEKNWVGGEKNQHLNGTVELSDDKQEIISASDLLGLKLQRKIGDGAFADVDNDAADRPLAIVWVKETRGTKTVDIIDYVLTEDTEVKEGKTYYEDADGNTDATPAGSENPASEGWYEKRTTSKLEPTFSYEKQEGEAPTATGKGNSGPYTYTIKAVVTETVDDGQGGTTTKTTYVDPYLETTDKDGNAYIYRIQEEDVPDNYKESYDPTKLLNVTNTYNVTDSLKVTKTWDDAQNAEGLRPDKVIVHLYKVVDVEDLTPAEIAAAEATAGTIDDYQIKWSYDGVLYDSEDAAKAVAAEALGVSVDEVTGVSEVSAQDQFDAAKAEAVANAREQKNKDTTPVHIEVVRKEITPKNGEKDTWSTGIVWNDLDVYDEKGNVIKYVVIEESVFGYTTTYSVDGGTTYKTEGDRALEVELDGDTNTTQRIDVKNSLAPATNKVEVTKIWDDQNDIDGARPDSGVTFILKKYVWDKTLNSGKGGYTTTATEVTKRPATQADVEADTTGETKLGDEITVNRMLLTGTATAAPGTVWNETTTGGATASTWKGEWINLPLTENGKTILYIVEEVTSGEKFGEPGTAGKYSNKPIITGDQIKGYTVTNEYTPEETEFIGIKKWVDGDATITHNNSADLPAMLTLWRTNVVPNNWDENTEWTNLGTLAALDATKAPNAHVDWSTSTGTGSQKDDTFTITGLAKKDGNGATYYYKVVEASIDGYQTTYLNSGATDPALRSRDNALYSGGTIENAAKVGNVEITKKFVDSDGNIIPKAALPQGFMIKVTYVWNNTTAKKFEKKEAKLVIGDLTPDANGVYKWTLNNVAAGTKVTAEEIGYDSPTGYSYKSTTANVNGDNESTHVDGKPTYAEFTMPTDAGAVNNAPVLRAYNPGTGTEPEKPSIAFVNTYDRNTGAIAPIKVWDDDSDAAGKRPDSVTFTITATNGGDLTKTYAVIDDGSGTKVASIDYTMPASKNSGDEWYVNEADAWEIGDLPTHTDDGKQICYVVKENTVPTGYQRLYPQANVGGISIYLNKGDYKEAIITNAYTEFEVTKKWIDVDGTTLRPTAEQYKSMVKLFADSDDVTEDNKTKLTVTPNADGTYTLKWTGLDRRTGGDLTKPEIVYSVTEPNAVTGYSAGVYSNHDDPNTRANEANIKDKALRGGTITNTQLVKVDVKKIWDDNNNHDGQRPSKIKVTLYQNGVPYKTSILTTGEQTLSNTDSNFAATTEGGKDVWTWTSAWTNLPYADANGSVYNYTATETNIGDGTGLWGILGNEGTIRQILLNAWNTNKDTLTFTITNSDDEDKIGFTVDKIWDDMSDADKMRPSTIYYRLYQKYDGQTATAGEEVLVTTLPAGAKVYTNTNTAGSVDWTEATYNEDAGYIAVTIPEDKTQGTLNRVIFDNLPKFARVNKGTTENPNWVTEEIVYIIKEDANISTPATTTDATPEPVFGYTTTITGDYKKGFTIKNKHEDTTITKTTSAIKAISGRKFEAGDEFTFTITPKDNAPRPARDYVTITPTSGTSADIPLPTFTFTAGDLDGVALEAGKPKTFEYELAETNAGKTLNDLKYDNSKKTLKITVRRTATGGIEILDTDVAWDNADKTFTNIYGGVVDLTLRKVWIDKDQDGTIMVTRPTSVDFKVTAETKVITQALVDKGFALDNDASTDTKKIYTQTFTLTEADHSTADEATWQRTTGDLPKLDAANNEIKYSVSEDQIPNYNEPIVIEKGTLFTVTNTYESTEIDGTKTWIDPNPESHNNSSEITFVVKRLKPGEDPAVDASWETLTEGKDYHVDWKDDGTSKDKNFTIRGLAKYVDASANPKVEHQYRVTEVAITGYTTKYLKNPSATEADYLDNNGGEIRNIIEQEYVEIPVTKEWIGKAVKDVDVDLKSDMTGDTALETYTFEKDAFDSASSASEKTYTFTRPNGTGVDPGYEKYNLDPNSPNYGKLIIYSVKETTTGDFTTSYLSRVGTEDKTDGTVGTDYTVKVINDNSEKITVYAQKQWDKDSDAKDERTDVQFRLMQTINGAIKPVDDYEITPSTGTETIKGTQTITANKTADVKTDAGTVKWPELPKFDKDGNAITYTVEEIGEPDGYTKSDPTGEGTISKPYIITNTKDNGETEVAVRKVWDDQNNQDGKRPTSVTVSIKAPDWDGKDVDGNTVGILTLSKDNNWTGRFTKLPTKDPNGKKLEYTVDEAAVAGYTKLISGNAKDGYTITNRYETAKTSVTATKVWDDGAAGSAAMHQDVILHLYGKVGGRVVYDAGVKKIAKDANPATATWDNLPKYHYSSTELEWEVVEEAIPAYGSKVEYGYVDGTVTPAETKWVESISDIPSGFSWNGEVKVTNIYEGPVTEVSVSKRWEDFDNADGKRPGTVTYELWKKVDGTDSKVAEQTVTVAADGSANHKWTDLPVTEEKVTGTETVQHVQVTLEYVNINDDTDVKSVDDYELLPGADVLAKSDYEEVVEHVITGYRESADPAHEITVDEYNAIVEADALNGTANAALYEAITVDETKYVNKSNSEDVITDPTAYAALPDVTKRDYVEKETETTIDESIDVTEEVAVIYYVKEQQPADYNAPVVVSTGAGTYQVINSRDRELQNLTITKVWHDDFNSGGARPDHITVTLTGTDAATSTTIVELSEIMTGGMTDGTWTYEFKGLPKNIGGHAITYTVDEAHVEHYEKAIDNSSLTIVNSHHAGDMTLTVTKFWKDADGNVLPSQDKEVTFRLIQVIDGYMKDMGDSAAKTIPAGATGDDLTVVWTDLASKVGGKVATYTVEEVPIEGYTVTMPDGVIEDEHDSNKLSLTVINTKDPEPEKITIKYIDPLSDDPDTPILEEIIERGGDEPGTPGDPSHTGYTFTGWKRTVDADGNVTYTATYAEIPEPEPIPVPEVKFKVTYVDPKGADGAMILKATKFDTSDEADAEAENKDGKPNDPSHDGYTFVGWVKNQDSFGDWILVAKYNETPKPPEKEKRTISYIDPESGNPVLLSVDADEAASITPPAPEAHEGKQFIGWLQVTDTAGNTIYVARYSCPECEDCKNTPAPPAEPAKTPTAAPMTGDMNNMMLWILVAVIAVSTMLIILLLRQRSKTKKR